MGTTFHRRIAALASIGFLVLFPYSPAWSDSSDWYGGVALSNTQQETTFSDGSGFDVDRVNVRLKFGRLFWDYLSFEAQFGLMGQSNITEDPVFTSGVYARLQKNFDSFGLYALVGAGNVQTLDNEDGGDEVSQSGGSFGFGLALYGNEYNAGSALFLEVLRLVNSNETDVDSVGIGYQFLF
ncbi:MAG: hypothetical protein AAF434_00875 [Pseudomonadota bacterium]